MRASRFRLELILTLVLLLMAIAPHTAAAQTPTSFGIASSTFQDYYQKRGGVRTFGYPISRQFILHGFQVQIFQRGIFQRLPNGSVTTMNLLDSGMMPYGSFNFSAVPTPDHALLTAAPPVTDPDYSRKAIDFVLANAPDQWNGLPVNFGRTFMSTVRLEDAFPEGNRNQDLLPLLNLELWGLPTSAPAYDPANHSFVYQRFQRGIMHYDASNGATQGLLLGDYFKSILTGQNLPADVENQAVSSPFFRQYDAAMNSGPLRPSALPGSDLTHAFEAGSGDPRYGVVVMGSGIDNSLFVQSALSSLGAGSWYSFGNAAEAVGKAEMVRPKTDLADVADRARRNPGKAWLIGNEPNVPDQDELTPEKYSDFLAGASRVIKAADPTATLVGPNTLNWDRTCNGCLAFTPGQEWSTAFVADYQKRYGPLPLDVWGTHVYTIDWEHLPMLDASGDQEQVKRVRRWLDSSRLGLPMWVTEFGVLWGYEGSEWQEKGDGWIMLPKGRFRDDLISQYLDSMLEWLNRSGIAEKWFLYATSPSPEPYAQTVAGVSLLKSGTLTLTTLGERYRSWATGAGSQR